MASAENVKATRTVGERVRRVASSVAAVDNRVADVDDRVAGVNDRVAGVDDRVARVDDMVTSAAHDLDDEVRGVREQELVVDDSLRIGQAVNDVDQVKRSSFNSISTDYGASHVISEKRLRDSIHKWLFPPDPSTNHNIAYSTHHKKTATWFFQRAYFQKWKSTGSLLWIHGKRAPSPTSLSICSDPILNYSWLRQEYSLVSGCCSIQDMWLIFFLSSTIIQDIKALCETGDASMAYFYFDFRNASKQGLHDLLPSLLTQLCARSSPCCDILSKLYSVHNDGKEQPSDNDLTICLKEMLSLPNQRPIYLILDALDESPNTSGISSPRERVLHLLEDLVDLHLPNLHICVTSRPEIDIRDVLEPLTSLRVSLHDEAGHKQDIADYIKSVVYLNSEPMRRWRTEDKNLVIEVLSERADGM